MKIMGKRTTKGFQRMEPLMKGGMGGHFLPINIALTASKDINLVVAKKAWSSIAFELLSASTGKLATFV